MMPSAALAAPSMHEWPEPGVSALDVNALHHLVYAAATGAAYAALDQRGTLR